MIFINYINDNRVHLNELTHTKNIFLNCIDSLIIPLFFAESSSDGKLEMILHNFLYLLS